ncbi:MAG: type II toxin-antitoxin system prevent-host-death family antitoxin [Anaerolineae bacterium]|nr:type II toxin-antitoxin system prevent-host-death family antitoxin [Anaerolineae bacterium]
MITKTVSATEAKNRFGAVLREIKRSGGPIVVQRDGEPVAIILSVTEYQTLQKTASVDEDPVLAAFGLWADREDIDETWLEEGRK